MTLRLYIKQDPIKIDSISLYNRIILCSYIRSNANEDFSNFLPIGAGKQPIRLSPRTSFSGELINILCLNGIIQLDYCNLPRDALPLIDGSEAICTIGSAICLPNVMNVDNKLLTLTELSVCIENSLAPQTDKDMNDLEKLWKELALHEALEYLNYVLSERGFPFKPGEKTIDILNEVLTKFSTSQAFYFIYSATKSASDFHQLKNTSIFHAANIVPGKIRSLFDRAVSEKWEITKYSRNYKGCPPSALNNILYDKIIGFSGLDHVPGSVLPWIEV